MGGCKSCGGAADPMSVYEIPPQPTAAPPARPQRMQGQRSTSTVTAEPSPAPKTARRTRRSR